VIAAVGALLLMGGVAGAWYYHDQTSTHNVEGSSTVEFVATDEPAGDTSAATPATTAKAAAGPALADWPLYGYEPDRTRAASFPGMRPPYKTLWERKTRLMEFPPVTADGKVFVAESRGHFYALDGKTGKLLWEHQFNRCSAGSPAYADGVVYHGFMHTRCKRVPGAKGMVVAMDAKTGKIKWKVQTEVIESSVLEVNGDLFFGGWDGNIVSLDAKTGKQRWSYHADSGITSSVAYHAGNVFVGSDGGAFYALNANSGKLLWKSGSFSKFGQREYFYATPEIGRAHV